MNLPYDRLHYQPYTVHLRDTKDTALFVHDMKLTGAADAVALGAGSVIDTVPRLALGRRVARPVLCRGRDAGVIGKSGGKRV